MISNPLDSYIIDSWSDWSCFGPIPDPIAWPSEENVTRILAQAMSVDRFGGGSDNWVLKALKNSNLVEPFSPQPGVSQQTWACPPLALEKALSKLPNGLQPLLPVRKRGERVPDLVLIDCKRKIHVVIENKINAEINAYDDGHTQLCAYYQKVVTQNTPNLPEWMTTYDLQPNEEAKFVLLSKELTWKNYNRDYGTINSNQAICWPDSSKRGADKYCQSCSNIDGHGCTTHAAHAWPAWKVWHLLSYKEFADALKSVKVLSNPNDESRRRFLLSVVRESGGEPYTDSTNNIVSDRTLRILQQAFGPSTRSNGTAGIRTSDTTTVRVLQKRCRYAGNHADLTSAEYHTKAALPLQFAASLRGACPFNPSQGCCLKCSPQPGTTEHKVSPEGHEPTPDSPTSDLTTSDLIALFGVLDITDASKIGMLAVDRPAPPGIVVILEKTDAGWQPRSDLFGNAFDVSGHSYYKTPLDGDLHDARVGWVGWQYDPSMLYANNLNSYDFRWTLEKAVKETLQGWKLINGNQELTLTTDLNEIGRFVPVRTTGPLNAAYKRELERLVLSLRRMAG